MRALNIFLFSALSILATAADAGTKQTAGVKVSAAGRTAYGALTAVRATSNDVEYIDCEMKVKSSGTTVSCHAKDRFGNTATCSDNFENHIQAVKMIGPSSWVQFRWDGIGNCENIMVWNDSAFIP